MGLKQASANVPLRSFFDSVPEVRALCSVGITRLQRSYGPVRLPVPAAIPSDGVGIPCSTDTGSPSLTRSAFPACRAPYPGGPSRCSCRLLPGSCCLPRFQGGSASTTSLSRPAQASLALRPAGLLAHLTVDFVTRLRPAQLPGPGRSLATMFIDNYMGGSFPHWQTAPVRRTRKFWVRAGSPVRVSSEIDGELKIQSLMANVYYRYPDGE